MSQPFLKISECLGLQQFRPLLIFDHLFSHMELLVLVLEKIIPPICSKLEDTWSWNSCLKKTVKTQKVRGGRREWWCLVFSILEQEEEWWTECSRRKTIVLNHYQGICPVIWGKGTLHKRTNSACFLPHFLFSFLFFFLSSQVSVSLLFINSFIFTHNSLFLFLSYHHSFPSFSPMPKEDKK